MEALMYESNHKSNYVDAVGRPHGLLVTPWIDLIMQDYKNIF